MPSTFESSGARYRVPTALVAAVRIGVGRSAGNSFSAIRPTKTAINDASLVSKSTGSE
jgi:hypothetical protein